MKTIPELQKQKAALIAYIQMKLDAGDDWHAICDAGMDLREVDAMLLILNELAAKGNQ